MTKKELKLDDYPVMNSWPACKKHLEGFLQAYHNVYYGHLRIELKTIGASYSESYQCQVCGRRAVWDVHRMTEQKGLYQ